MTNSFLSCRTLESTVACSITIEHEKIDRQEHVQCHIRLHGRRDLSSVFAMDITRENRTQMNVICEDIGEITAMEIRLGPNTEGGFFIQWIEISIPKKSILIKFDVQRWLHPRMGDERTQLILMPNRVPGYASKKIMKTIEQPKRDYVKYTFLIDIAQTKGTIDKSILSIDLIGKYGRTSSYPINKKSDRVVPLQTDARSNRFETTMLDVGSLTTCEIQLEDKQNTGSYFLSNIQIFREQCYEVNLQQWIENGQRLTGHLRRLEIPNPSILSSRIQSKSAFVLWLTSSESVKKKMELAIEFQFNCENTIADPVKERVTIQPESVSVLSISAACTTPFKSLTLGYDRKKASSSIKDLIILDISRNQHYYFHLSKEPPKSMQEIDYYSFLPITSHSSAITSHSKHYIISMLTSATTLSDKHTIKVVLRGERGLTSILSLHNSSWNTVPFQAKHRDRFLLLGSDVGKITGLTVFHASEHKKFAFDILEIFLPDTEACTRIRGKYELFNEIIDLKCDEPATVYIVRIKSGFSTLNNTADLLLTLTGEEASIEWSLLTCETDMPPFRTGQLDTFYIPSKRLGKIRAADISCSDVEKTCKWFCEMIYVHDTVYNIKSSYQINRWCGDHQESDMIDSLNTISKATIIQPASTKQLTRFLITLKTGLRILTYPIVTPSIYLFFAGPFGSSPVIHLNELITRKDLFQSLEINEFNLTIADTGMPDIMRVWNTEDLAPWICEYIDIKDLTNSKTVQLVNQSFSAERKPSSVIAASFPMNVEMSKVNRSFPSYIDLEADSGRVTISLPGPRDDAAYPSYQLTIRAAERINPEVEERIHIQLKGDQGQSKSIPVTARDQTDSTKNETLSNFLLYGICPLGELKEVSIACNRNQQRKSWQGKYLIIYDYFHNRSYGAKLDNWSMSSTFQLGLIEDTDPNHLKKELDRIAAKFVSRKTQEINPVYRILYKTQANTLTTLGRNAEILIRLHGDKSSSFFPLEHTRPLSANSLNEYFYQEDTRINGLNKIDLQLLDDEHTRWACESIEIQDLLTSDIITFPINDVLESTLKTDRTKAKITTWKSGVKSTVVYLIRIRTGQQSASLNFRYGSAYLFLKLYGDSGTSNEIALHIPFEQTHYLKSNQIDTFEIGQILSTVGQIGSIDLHHNGKKEDFWEIDWISIKDVATNRSFQFTVGKCLNKDLGIHSKVLHIPVDASTRQSAREMDSMPNYLIRVKTGSQTSSHSEEMNSSSLVSVVLIDALNDSVRIPLERMNSSGRSSFQPDQEDRFEITIAQMLELKVLQIYFHGSFPWFCERILITDQKNGLSYRFDVDQWFTEKSNDNPVHVIGQREDDTNWLYSVTVKTQSILPAQTDLRGKIFLSISGANSSLNDAVIASGKSRHGMFHAGGENVIELKSNRRLGEIQSIEIRLEIAEWQSWLCDTIEIIDLAARWDFHSRTMLTKTYKFPINRWLGAHAMDKRTVLRAFVNQEPGYAKMPTYIVHVLTSTKNSHTDSDIPFNVYLQLFCTSSKRVYGPILLDKSSNNTQSFRKGQIDEFYINDLSSCGDIDRIRLWHDGGKAISWHCEWIKITNVHKSEVYEFLVEKILDEDFEEGSSNLILKRQRKDESDEGELPSPETITM